MTTNWRVANVYRSPLKKLLSRYVVAADYKTSTVIEDLCRQSFYERRAREIARHEHTIALALFTRIA